MRLRPVVRSVLWHRYWIAFCVWCSTQVVLCIIRGARAAGVDEAGFYVQMASGLLQFAFLLFGLWRVQITKPTNEEYAEYRARRARRRSERRSRRNHPIPPGRL